MKPEERAIPFTVHTPASTTHQLSGGKILGKFPQCLRIKPVKVMVLGATGVGKSEDIYTHETLVKNEFVCFQILDSGGHTRDTEQLYLESNIRWADAFVLMYSVTDKCSFDECIRLKFFINLYNKRRRFLTAPLLRDIFDVPVVLVGNKVDQYGDRMIATNEGHRRAREIGCAAFHEISVRESVDEAHGVFEDLFQKIKSCHRASSKNRRRSEDPPPPRLSSCRFLAERVISEGSLHHCVAEVIVPEVFRGRARTEGALQWKRPLHVQSHNSISTSPLCFRRMSISMRGSISN